MRSIKITIFILSILFCFPFTQIKTQTQKRAMNFLDIIQMRSLGSQKNGDISPDGKWFVYTIRVPDWEKNRRYEDIYLTTLTGSKTMQITFTKDKNKRYPKWYKDSSFFAFLSNLSDDKNQIYFMRPDGGEAWQVTDDKFGVNSYEFSSNGKYLAYLSGKPDERQLWVMPGQGGKTEKLTDHKTHISSYLWNPNSKKIYFVAPDSIALVDKEIKEKKNDALIKDEIEPLSHLWEIDIETKEKIRLTGGKEYSVSDVNLSDDGTKIAFIDQSKNSEVYILDLNTNIISRLTNNSADEWSLSFSPNSKWFAFVCGSDGNFDDPGGKIYIMPTEGGETKNLLSNFDFDDNLGYFWSEDSRYIYFTSQVGVNYHLFSVSIDNDQIKLIAKFEGGTNFRKDKDSGKFIIRYSDSENPADYYYCESENINDRDKWIRLTDSNPQVRGFLLGKQETIRWKSTDDTTIEGILIKPVNYSKAKRYPLIVQIHGGPATASINNFNSYSHIFAANDYVVFQPNYRGSSGYGEKFKKEIEVDWFGQSFDDIMTGVDYLIEREIVHPDSMGIMGWSFGGDLCNEALVSTNRFKAISTGASSNVPKKYLNNAKTPTLIHCGENDMNNISQSEELYTDLKKIGVPTEFIVYPNTGHIIGIVEYGIGNMRYMIVKMQAEFNWFEKWIRGKEKGWIDCKEMIESFHERQN